jgi:hypothetical protein
LVEDLSNLFELLANVVGVMAEAVEFLTRAVTFLTHAFELCPRPIERRLVLIPLCGGPVALGSDLGLRPLPLVRQCAFQLFPYRGG